MRAFYESPVGRLLLEANESSLTGLYFQSPADGDSENHHRIDYPDPTSKLSGEFAATNRLKVLDCFIHQLDEYFEGKRTEFSLDEFDVEPPGTVFQRRVWKELQNIPFGETISYGELARRIGQPSASRAVGLANGRNPISIIIPCHRVIGSNGTLTGYGGGLERKQILLELERRCLCCNG
jgi:methylated-DNA-[protein]-cysteine S-methyltransferase